MSKWVLDEWDEQLDYPTLGFRADPGDILDATAAPDGRWSLNGDQGAAETVTRYTIGGDPSYVEPGANHILAWSDDDNTYVPQAPETLLATDEWANTLSASYAAKGVGEVAVLAGDGTTDDTAALQAAIDATPTGGTLYLPDPDTSYRMVSGVTITSPIAIVANKAKIKVDVPNASGTTALFDIQSDNVTIRGLWFDGSHKTAGNVPSGNRYCIRALGTDDSNRRQHITVTGCHFTELDTGWYSGTKITSSDPNLLVVHAAYFDWVTDVHFDGNTVDRISGTACFMRHSVKTTQNRNYVNNTGWYSLHYDGGDYHGEMAHNRVTGDRNDIRFWGGSLDIMCDAGPSYFIDVHDNYVSGTHTYGNDGAVRCSSGQHIDIHHNVFENIHSYSGSSSYVSNVAVIAVYMRQASGTANKIAPNYVNIHDNHAIAGCAAQPFVLAQNGQTSVGGTGPITLGVGLSIHKNLCETVDSTHYFASLATIHGQDGGWSNVSVERNVWSGKPGDTGSVSAGAINVLTTSGTTVKHVSIQGNQLTYNDGAAGTSSTSQHLGIGIGQYVDDVIVKGNMLRGFWFSIRAYSNAGTNLDLYENTHKDAALRVLVDSTVAASMPARRIPRSGGLAFNKYDQDGGPTITAGTGTPEGSVTASIGSIYLRDDGSAGTSVYQKESGSGNTGWRPVSTTALEPLRSENSNYTATAFDKNIQCNGASVTITLPTAVGISGKRYNIKNVNAASASVASTSSQTFDGAAGPLTLAQWETVRLISNGSNWLKL